MVFKRAPTTMETSPYRGAPVSGTMRGGNQKLRIKTLDPALLANVCEKASVLWQSWVSYRGVV